MIEVGNISATNLNDIKENLRNLLSDAGKTILNDDENIITPDFESIVAIRFIAKIAETYNIKITIKEFFSTPTLNGIAKKIADKLTSTATPLEFPLSFSQKRLWISSKIQSNDKLYHEYACYELKGDLNLNYFITALDCTWKKHDILRVEICDKNNEPYQKIKNSVELPITFEDYSNLGKNNNSVIASCFNEVINTPIDFERAGMVHFFLFKLSEDSYYFLIKIHHIIFDAWSLGVLLTELSDVYSTLLSSGRVITDTLKLQYQEFALWQRQYFTENVLNNQRAFWVKKLADFPMRFDLPGKRSSIGSVTYNGDAVSLQLSDEQFAKLYDIALKQNVTLFIVIFSAYLAFLHRYTLIQRLVIGTPIANRHYTNVENLIGYFSNSLAVPSEIDFESSFLDFMKKIENFMLESHDYQDIPFDFIVDQLNVDRIMSQNPVFQIWFVLLNDTAEKINIPNVHANSLSLNENISRFDMALIVEKNGRNLQLNFNYMIDLFDRVYIEELAENFIHFINQLDINAEKSIGSYSVLSKYQLERALYTWNMTQKDFGPFKPVHNIFSECAQKFPNSAALVQGENKLTYQELDALSNRVAHCLLKNNVSKNSRVGLSVTRSLDWLVGLIGILKSGATCVPIDPFYPKARIDYVLENSDSHFLLTQERLLSSIYNENFSRKIACLDNQIEWQNYPDTPVDIKIEEEDLAYLIYTSGTTGRPKGVQMTHKGIFNVTHGMADCFTINKDSRVLQFASMSFDAAISEWTMPLTRGGSLYLLSQSEEGILTEEILEICEKFALDFVKVTPSVLRAFTLEKLRPVKKLVIMGEAISGNELRKWLNSGKLVWNAYGPSEGTECTSATLCSPDKPATTVGRPIANVEFYLLDDYKQIVPVGVKGEIYIGGVGVSPGYWHRDEETNKKFIDLDFGDGKKRRVYCTGDWGKYLPDGEVVYCGRRDQQIKIRGFRVELGEIETLLKQCPLIRDAAVLYEQRKNEASRLEAYCVPQNLHDVTELKENTRAWLSEQLPVYMIPQDWFIVEKMPLNQHGKVDRKKLRESPQVKSKSSHHVSTDQNKIENKMETLLKRIWQEILKINNIDIEDNFFEMGGDSILCIQLAAKLREAGIKLDVRQIFKSPTISGLLKIIKNDSTLSSSLENKNSWLQDLFSLPPYINDKLSDFEDAYSLTPLQLGFLANYLRYSTTDPTYNRQAVCRFKGKYNQDILQRAWQEVVKTFPIMRTAFFHKNLEQPLQFVYKIVNLNWDIIDFSDIRKQEQNHKLETYLFNERCVSIAFDQAPLYRIAVVLISNSEFYFVLNFPHILLDGWSVFSVLNAFYKRYSSLLSAIDLPIDENNYFKKFIQWQSKCDLKQAENFWRNYFKDKLEKIQDLFLLRHFYHSNQIEQKRIFSNYTLNLDSLLSKEISHYAKKEKITISAVVLAVWVLVLKHYTRVNNLIIGVSVSGRFCTIPHADEIVGMTINTLPLFVSLDKGLDFCVLSKTIQQDLLSIQQYAYLPLSAIQACLDNNNQNLFDHIVVFQNYPRTEEAKDANVEMTFVRQHFENTEYSLTVGVEIGDLISIYFGYQENLINGNKIKQISEIFLSLLRKLIEKSK